MISASLQFEFQNTLTSDDAIVYDALDDTMPTHGYLLKSQSVPCYRPPSITQDGGVAEAFTPELYLLRHTNSPVTPCYLDFKHYGSVCTTSASFMGYEWMSDVIVDTSVTSVSIDAMEACGHYIKVCAAPITRVEWIEVVVSEAAPTFVVNGGLTTTFTQSHVDQYKIHKVGSGTNNTIFKVSSAPVEPTVFWVCVGYTV